MIPIQDIVISPAGAGSVNLQLKLDRYYRGSISGRSFHDLIYAAVATPSAGYVFDHWEIGWKRIYNDPGTSYDHTFYAGSMSTTNNPTKFYEPDPPSTIAWAQVGDYYAGGSGRTPGAPPYQCDENHVTESVIAYFVPAEPSGLIHNSDGYLIYDENSGALMHYL